MNQPIRTDLLIVGAGPFGLAMSAHASELGIRHVVVGRPMSFWTEHMPAGMLLRSGCNWHLDPDGAHTIERFLETRGQVPSDVEPLSLGLYLSYAEWFMREAKVSPLDAWVTRLDEEGGRFSATFEDDSVVTAERVLLAVGFSSFAYTPADLAELLPSDRSMHACECVDPTRFEGRRVLIVGGRQSAFEYAALLAEAGAAAVHICHRHETPSFDESDWTWVGPLLERIVNEPGWYRALSASERASLNARFWAEGRTKLEPWLGPRVHRDGIEIHPRTNIIGADRRPDAVHVRLDSGATLTIDDVLFATGYKPDLRRVPFLRAGNLVDRVACRDGSPVLDEAFQTTVPNLYITSLPAARDFGLFFAFTAAARASARIIGRALTATRS